jgi:phosphatidylglycerol:prolipoprotein diacylglycerol transferase
LSWLYLWEGGLVWYGGVGGAIILLVWQIRKLGLPPLRTMDIVAPATFLGLTLGRLGCLAAGDDFGSPIKSEAGKAWGVVFSNPDALVYPDSWRTIPLHPAQLYMALNAFILFVILRAILRRKRFDGQVIAASFILYAIGRFIIEIYRGDAGRGYAIEGLSFLGRTVNLSTSQFISVFVFAAGVAMLAALYKRTTAAVAQGA